MRIQRIFRYRIPLKAPLAQNGFQIRERRGFLLCSPGGELGEFAPLPGFSPSREEDILRDLLTFQRCRDCGMEIPEEDLKTPEALFAAAMLKFPLKAGKARRFRFQDSGPILLFADLARGAVGTQAVDLFFELSDSPVV